MMRGRKAVAVAVRQPSGGILVHVELLAPRLYQNRLFRLPLLRGVLLLWDMLVLGTRMMAFAANVAAGEITQENQKTSAMSTSALVGTLIFSLTFVILLFFLGP